MESEATGPGNLNAVRGLSPWVAGEVRGNEQTPVQSLGILPDLLRFGPHVFRPHVELAGSGSESPRWQGIVVKPAHRRGLLKGVISGEMDKGWMEGRYRVDKGWTDGR